VALAQPPQGPSVARPQQVRQAQPDMVVEEVAAAAAAAAAAR
jgi:hypothetical protein